MPVEKEQIPQLISENNICSVADVYPSKGQLQEYYRSSWKRSCMPPLSMKKQKVDLNTDNKRNDHSLIKFKGQYGASQVDIPRDRNGKFEPKRLPTCRRCDICTAIWYALDHSLSSPYNSPILSLIVAWIPLL